MLEQKFREELLHSFLTDNSNPYDEHGHGSGVASLAAYYALNVYQGAENEGKIWIASARVLNRNNEIENRDENEHENLRLFSNILREVVETFVLCGVRIFNLSVGIISRKWNAEAKRTVPRRSWIARTIDKLSRKYDVVFIISAGNILAQNVKWYWEDNKPYPKYFMDEESKILDPGQAALALTVGSIVLSTTVVGNAATAQAIALQTQPSPFTRCGPGISKEIKPELIEYGGNYLIDENNSIRTNPGTDVVMASHQLTPAITHYSGTSFAAPRVAHKMARILHDLQTLDLDNISAPLLKAFTINSASYRKDYGHFDDFRAKMDDLEKKYWLNIVGYGQSDPIRATECDAYSAILFFQGEITPNTVAYFDIPVPKCLANTTATEIKRLTVTVVHSPEVQRWGLEKYLGTTLKWRMFRGDTDKEEIIQAMSIENNDIDGETTLPKELKFELGVNMRSRGIIQHDFLEWKRHKQEYSNNFYTLAIAAYEKWSSEPVPYAVVVRLEDTSQTVQVYSQIQNMMVQIQSQIGN